MLATLSGLGTGLSLIIAIGAQNAFVLRQGLRREHVLLIVAICAGSDALLILLGISGIGLLIATSPLVLTIIRFAGAAFLIGYGLLAARRAFSKEKLRGDPAGKPLSVAVALTTCLALTWLNPHVYLDTLLLLGSIANTHGEPGRWYFGGGAVLGSVLWFTALGYGARLLAPFFAKPLAWRILDGVIALVMLGLGLLLLLKPL
ncbi:LysE/ArgO family amino acid transporter [Psychromicrobium lacuslunae]|uniref:Amino acid transporter n=1 Tax=Psychromicrobium lacuslunae TaxID=1618207 RepID=A0A0D4C2Z3_9MICC|nr:LysE/ArgO family amino acid transporter [Psychromicrobium lacuslunae]AJT42765.1 amino acid transporter [Psychromicrobium lacuslunae]